MAKEKTKTKDSTDRFVVLQKGNRTLVLSSPTPKQLKRYKKKSWSNRGRIAPDQDSVVFSESLNGMLRAATTENGEG